MKLQDINRLDEAIALHRANQIVEGILSDIVASGVTSMQTWLKGHGKTVEQLGLQGLVAAARKLNVSLLDDSEEANAWWKSAFDAFQAKHGYKITKGDRLKLITSIKAKIEPEVNRDLEDVKKRLEDVAAQRSKQGKSSFDVSKLYKAVFGDEEEPAPRRRRSRRELADVEEGKVIKGVYVEGLADTISNALDVLDPNKRAMKGAALIRASNNAKIAAAAINILARELPGLHAKRAGADSKRQERKGAAEAAERAELKTKETFDLKFKVAKALNSWIKKFYEYKDAHARHDPEYDPKEHSEQWLISVHDYIEKEFGVNIHLKKVPSNYYPTNKRAFRKQYAPKQEEPIQAEVVDEPKDDYAELMSNL